MAAQRDPCLQAAGRPDMAGPPNLGVSGNHRDQGTGAGPGCGGWSPPCLWAWHGWYPHRPKPEGSKLLLCCFTSQHCLRCPPVVRRHHWAWLLHCGVRCPPRWPPGHPGPLHRLLLLPALLPTPSSHPAARGPSQRFRSCFFPSEWSNHH